jgi:hypothetical protein
VTVLERFDGDDLTSFGDRIRAIAHSAASMEEAAQQVADVLHDGLTDDAGAPALSLVRVYKTHPHGELPPDLRAFADEVAGVRLEPDVRCLTLLATRGARPEWNDRHRSQGHKAIPLPSVAFLERLPMVAGLVTELGLDPQDVVRPGRVRVVELSQRTYDVFHVEHALGSPVLPAQDFVSSERIASAVGFGGVLLTGDFFAVVLFSRVPVNTVVAQQLRVLSLAVRVALLPFGKRVFAG